MFFFSKQRPRCTEKESSFCVMEPAAVGAAGSLDIKCNQPVITLP